MDGHGLSGFTIGVTADRRAADQILQLERQGATVVHGATLELAPIPDDEILAATAALIDDPPDLLVLLAGRGFRSWFETAEASGLGPALRDALLGVEIWSRGNKPAGAAIGSGFAVTRRFPTHQALLEALAKFVGPESVITIQLDGTGHLDGVDRLLESGADLRFVDSYRYRAPSDPEPALRLLRAILDGQVDAVTFTSRPAVRGLCELADTQGLLDELLGALSGRCLPICIGAVTAAAATKAGVDPAVAQHGSLGVLVHETVCHMRRRSGAYEAYGVAFRVQGRMICVGDRTVQLTDRERDLLDALRNAQGRVVSKGQLLREVWAGDSDPHVVEVNVARLRRRLGDASETIETVYRRGYRWSGVAVA